LAAAEEVVCYDPFQICPMLVAILLLVYQRPYPRVTPTDVGREEGEAGLIADAVEEEAVVDG
jgi:hypothetical protein